MMHSLVANEAALKVAVSYAEFPGNRSSRVIAAERVRGQDIKKCIEDPRFWEVVKGVEGFTKPPSDVSCDPLSNFNPAVHSLLRLIRKLPAASRLIQCAQPQLIYALESDSASLGKAYYAIKEMKELVAGAVDNVATQEYAEEIKVCL